MSFGAGGHGLTPEAVEDLIKIMSFDYMGGAEFEYGVLAKCLNQMYSFQKDYTQSAVEYSGQTFHIFAPSVIIDRCVNDLVSLAQSKTVALIKEAVQGKTDVVAWLDISNNVFFTLDEEMFTKFLGFLEVE